MTRYILFTHFFNSVFKCILYYRIWNRKYHGSRYVNEKHHQQSDYIQDWSSLLNFFFWWFLTHGCFDVHQSVQKREHKAWTTNSPICSTSIIHFTHAALPSKVRCSGWKDKMTTSVGWKQGPDNIYKKNKTMVVFSPHILSRLIPRRYWKVKFKGGPGFDMDQPW